VAPVRRVVTALREGHVAALDVRALGLVVVALGGGRARPGDAVDPRVGLDGVVARGTLLRAGDPLAVVHAADEGSAAAAATAVRHAITLTDEPPAPLPLVRQVIEG
jgi:thymidine phosphorylase